MKALLFFSLFLVACSSRSPFHAGEPLFAAMDDKEVSSFPSPPAPGSAAEERDLLALERIQRTRTAADCVAASAQKRPTADQLFPSYPFGESEEAREALWRIRSDAVLAVEKLKNKFGRERPFRAYPRRIHPCYDELHGKSYPSGHAAIAQLLGRVLVEVDPARAAEYRKEAKAAGRYRLVAGVHYPSDVLAGEALGNALFLEMRESPGFGAEVVRLKSLLKDRQ